LPPDSEQADIAAFLDAETAKIDRLVAEQRGLIALLKEKHHAIISQVVTKGLDPAVPMKAGGVELLGTVPAHWEVKRLKYLVSPADGIQMGPFGGMLLALDSMDTGYKVYGQENTISGDFSLGSRWIAEERYRSLSNYHLAQGDVVLTRKGSLGNARFIEHLPTPGIADSDTIRIRVRIEIVLPVFLTLVLHSADYVAVQIALTKRGAILAGLNTETIGNVSIILPPVNEQQDLMHFITAATARFHEQVFTCARALELLQERRAALISAAVTGKIDVHSLASAEAA
jgi:type I restriction enzyme S subunit